MGPCGSPTSWPCAGFRSARVGVRGVWGRHDLLTKHERLLRLEKASAERPIELMPEQARLLERFSPEFRERHIEAAHTLAAGRYPQDGLGGRAQG